MKKFITLFFVTMLLVLTGCQNNIDRVKNSVFPFDNSVTFGNLIENHPFFESVEWKEVKLLDNSIVVNVKCKYKSKYINQNTEYYFNKMAQEQEKYSKYYNRNEPTYSQVWDKDGKIYENNIGPYIYNSLVYQFLNSVYLDFQFRIPIDKNENISFNYIGFTFLENRKIDEYIFPSDLLEYLNNDETVDISYEIATDSTKTYDRVCFYENTTVDILKNLYSKDECIILLTYDSEIKMYY